MNDQTFQLVVRKGPRPGHVYSLTGSAMTIGRDPLADIVIDDPEISRQHARLTLTDSGYQVQDLGSTNGTYVDGKRLAGEAVNLRNGQILMTGSNVTMVYEVISAAADPMATMVAPAGIPFIPEPMPEPEPIPEPAPMPHDATALFNEPVKPVEEPLPSYDYTPEPVKETAPLPSFDEEGSAPLPAFDESQSSAPLPSYTSDTGMDAPVKTGGGMGGNRNLIIGIVVGLIVLCCVCLPIAYFALSFAFAQ